VSRRELERDLALALGDQAHAIVPANTAVLQGPRLARQAVFSQVGAELGDEFDTQTVSFEAAGESGVRDAVSSIIKRWKDKRPGLRALNEADEVLNDTDLAPTVALALAAAQLVEAKGGPSLLLVDDIDFGNSDHAAIVSAMSNVDQRAVGLAAVLGTGVDVSFVDQSPDRKTLDVWACPGRAADAWAALASDLSIDAVRYLRSVIHDPATHDALRKRLGDSNAFGRGPSPLDMALAELRQAGFVRIDSQSALHVTDSAIADHLG